jgi:hypothetical protein
MPVGVCVLQVTACCTEHMCTTVVLVCYSIHVLMATYELVTGTHACIGRLLYEQKASEMARVHVVIFIRVRLIRALYFESIARDHILKQNKLSSISAVGHMSPESGLIVA